MQVVLVAVVVVALLRATAALVSTELGDEEIKEPVLRRRNRIQFQPDDFRYRPATDDSDAPNDDDEPIGQNMVEILDKILEDKALSKSSDGKKSSEQQPNPVGGASTSANKPMARIANESSAPFVDLENNHSWTVFFILCILGTRFEA